ncbi:MAG: tRNA-dihydrouridine synthase family protein [Desulfobacteraceae bacterium]|nr:tRNA-dihydrouridine synthase family protein [Desulfobacteraceae bacterium]
MDELSKRLQRPLKIGQKQIPGRLVLAPMTQLGHVAYRELVSGLGGPGLYFSEMCNAKKVPCENRYVSPYFKWRDEEREQLVIQIFGADPHTMAAAARRIEDEGFFGIDLNFGCSVSTICRQNSGAAILKNPDLGRAIVESVRKEVTIPLFVKYRTGWQDDPAYAVEMARRFEDAGADALTFHPRVAPDRRTRLPKWSYINKVKAAVRIPVFGNGNVFAAQDCLKMLTQTGCDAVSIGRIAIARPWVFAKWCRRVEPGDDIYLETAAQMADLLSQHYEPKKALRRYKKFILYFAANFQFGLTLVSSISNVRGLREAADIVSEFLMRRPQVNRQPNLNLLI